MNRVAARTLDGLPRLAMPVCVPQSDHARSPRASGDSWVLTAQAFALEWEPGSAFAMAHPTAFAPPLSGHAAIIFDVPIQIWR